jgi:starch-binding outer membrane protein, SusD/RagB family
MRPTKVTIDMIRSRRNSVLAAAVVATMTMACNTDVASPDIVNAKNLVGAAALPVQLAGAYGDFATAWLGTGFSSALIDDQAQEGQVIVSALFTDEMHESDFFTNHLQIDLRNQSRDNTTLDDLFRILQIGRASTEKTAAAYAQYDPTNPGRLTMINLAAYSYELMAESFCGNVPVSNFSTSGTFVYGVPIGTDSLLRIAKTDFLQTLALAATDTQSANASTVQYEMLRAEVGLARALTFEGRLDSAALVAVNVPDTWLGDSIERSQNSPSENNGVYWYTNLEVRYGVTSGEGINGLNFTIDGANGDPRINIGAPNIQTTIGLDDYTLDTIQQKYPTYGSSGQLATATEARLIQAEEYILTGQAGPAVTMLNQARVDAAGMGPLAYFPPDMASQIDTLFAERAYDMWMTGHREGDLRRLVRPTGGTLPGYGLAQNTVWPTGAYFKNGTYGNQVALLIPRGEDNNPQYSDAGCNGGLGP